jgi:tetratricopeptide (TPR) repeat protein
MKRFLAIMILAAWAAGCQDGEALRHAGMGHLALSRGELDTAVQEFEEAIKLDNTLATAYCGMGDAYRQEGKMERAITPYQHAIQAMPFEFVYHFRLGTVYQALDRDKDAAKTYETAVRLDPDDPPVNINLGVVYFRIGVTEPDKDRRTEDLEKGRTYAEKAVELAPNHGFAWSNLGALYDALGDSYRAVGAYRKSIEIDPNQAPVHVNLGTAYLLQGRLDKALEEFQLAQAADPGSPLVRKRLAYVYSKQKKYGAAIEQWQEILKADPKDYEVRNSLAAVYMIFYLRHPEQDHLRQQALEEWHQSLEVRSDQLQVKAMVAKWAKPLEGVTPLPSDEAVNESLLGKPAEKPVVVPAPPEK